MSYYANYNISADCPVDGTAEKIADELRNVLSNPECLDVSGDAVSVSCYEDIDLDFFGELTEKYPGTFIAAEYIGEDGEIGVIYSKDGRYYTDFAKVLYPPFDEKNLPEKPQNSETAVKGA